MVRIKFPSKVTVAALQAYQLFEYPNVEIGDVNPHAVDGIFLVELSKVLAFNFILKQPPDKQWGRILENGTWNGMVGIVSRGEADLGICFIGINEEREKVVDFSEPYFISDRTFATKFPEPSPRAKVYTYPFDIQTWIGIFVLLFVIPLIYRSLMDAKRSYLGTFLKVFGTLFGQSVSEKDLKNRVLQGSWWCFAYLVSCSYSAVLASLLSVPLYNSSPTTVRQLAVAIQNGEFEVISVTGSSILPDMIKTGDEDLRYIAEMVDKNNWYVTIDKFLDEENFHGNIAHLANRVSFNFRFGKPPLSTKFISQDMFTITRVALIVNKKFCCKKELNYVIDKMNKAGIYSHINEIETYKAWFRAVKADSKVHERALSLDDIAGPLIFLMFGYFLSSCAFLVEIMYVRIKLTNIYKFPVTN
ncbi:glutamate receptor ionotropic, delta-1 [Caerostris darwini]|uniref:Glutamate receptor ionotropic, delta-1 n=1 Tax=Caerostris darwini TaxID=1538125 RepID=A0AAV4SAZ8_9ARAC|nr:glutamate receptor ionotropic, delta-1 [Caerostris darwini]